MAKQARPGDGADVVPLNSQARDAMIVSTIKELDALDVEKQAISDKIREIKMSNIKGTLGMKIADFNIARRLHALEGGDRDELLSTVQETFAALGVGQQLDWIKAAERVATGESKVPEAPTPD